MVSPRRLGTLLSIIYSTRTDGTCQLENSWDLNKSYTVGGKNYPLPFSWTAPNLNFVDNPEIPPGVLIGALNTPSSSSTTAAGPTSSASPNPAASPTSTGTGKSSNTGPIVGGVVAGIAVIGAAVLGIFYLRRRRTTPAYAAPSEGAPPSPFYGELQPQKGYMGQSDDGTTQTSSLPPATRMTPMRVYVRAFVPSLHSVRASCDFFLPESERPNDVSKRPDSVLYHERHFPCNLWIATRRGKHVGHHAGHAATRISWPTSPLITYSLSNWTLDSWRCSRMQNRQPFFLI